MPPHRSPTVLLLLLAFVAPLAALESAAQIDALPDITVADGERTWGGANGFAVTGLAGRRLALASERGPIHVALAAIRNGTVAPAQLRTLLAAEPELRAPEDAALIVHYNALLGACLTDERTLVCDRGVLRRQADAPLEREAKIAALQREVEELIGRLDQLVPQDLVRKAVQDTLERTIAFDQTFQYDEMPPVFARRVIRHGWLRDVLTDPTAAQPLEQSLDAAAAFVAQNVYADDALTFSELVNAFGRRANTLETQTMTLLQVQAAAPLYHLPAKRVIPRLAVILELPPATTVTAGQGAYADLRAARLHTGGRDIVSWHAPDDFQANAKAWRKLFPESGGNMVRNYFPPHIVITDPWGDVHSLITAGGRLTAPQGTAADTGRFLDQAAAILPDAAHIDLIGQYMFQYVFDSPDPSVPLAIGNTEIKSDIHQTAAESLATAAGGVCRGDCDDLSELYQHIAERQDKLAHVVILPAHAALAWAEQDNGNWHTYLLQTGPAYEFVDPDLGRSLEQAYKHFDQTANFDPNAVGLLLRFSGENTRSSWRLSKRIFSDPAYARTMIDVQRDWHYQTYLQGIEKMERLIASGDEDNANYRELAGLAAFTGQHAKAADYLDEAIARTDEETSRLAIRIEQANHLLEAGERERGETLLRDIIDRQLGELQQQLGTGIIEIGLNLAGTCISHDLPELAGRTMARTNLRMSQNLMRALLGVLQRNPDHPAWQTDPRLRMARRMVRRSANTAIALLDLTTPEQLADNDQLAACRSLGEAFLQAVAFADVDDRSQIPQRYATAAAYYRAMMDPQQFDTRLAAATMPQEDRDHRRGRQRGLDQLESDLPWIKASVPYWANRLSALIEDGEPAELDRERVAALGAGLEAAMVASRDRDLVGAATYYHLHLGQLITALLTEDAPALRDLLAQAAAKGDKRLRDRTAQIIGDTAPFLDQEWFATVMDLWREELDYKPKYFWIAWRAAIAGAEANALLAARRAAERYPEDPAFTAEYQFMQELLGEEDEAE